VPEGNTKLYLLAGATMFSVIYFNLRKLKLSIKRNYHIAANTLYTSWTCFHAERNKLWFRHKRCSGSLLKFFFYFVC